MGTAARGGHTEQAGRGGRACSKYAATHPAAITEPAASCVLIQSPLSCSGCRAGELPSTISIQLWRLVLERAALPCLST